MVSCKPELSHWSAMIRGSIQELNAKVLWSKKRKVDKEENKRATHSSPDEGILTPVTDWLNTIKKTIQQLWQIQWESYDGHLKSIQSNINKWNYPRSLNRRQQSVLCRLRIGHL
nr:unnamed protein product [Callosobruchus chinensis]